MRWSDEVHINRCSQAAARAKRQARLKKLDRLPEAEGSAGSDVLLAATCAVVATILMQQQRCRRSVKDAARRVLDSLTQFVPKAPAKGRTTGYANPRDKTATATTSGRPPLPSSAPSSASLQQSSQQSSQTQSQNKPKKKRRHRHR